jgi:hypothetical protein
VCVCVCIPRYREMGLLQPIKMKLCKAKGVVNSTQNFDVRWVWREVSWFPQPGFMVHTWRLFLLIYTQVNFTSGFLSCRFAGVTQVFITVKSST